MRRSTSGKLRQTGTPQKCVPSVQRGRTRPLRTKQGGPTWRTSCGVHRAHLLDLVHRRLPDLALRVQAGAHRPLVEQVEQRARLLEAHGERVRQHVERELRRDAERRAAARARPRPPRPPRRRARGRPDRRAISSGSTTSTRAGTVRVSSGREPGTMRWRWSWESARVGELLAEGVVRVVERAHQRRVDRDVQRVEPVAVAAPGRAPARAPRRRRARRGRARGARRPPPPAGARAPQSTSRERRPPRDLSKASSGAASPSAGRRERGLDDLVRARAAARRPRRRRPGRGARTSATMRSTTRRASSGASQARGHAPQPVQHDARDRVDHRGVARDRDHVARGLDRLLLGLAPHVASEGAWTGARAAARARRGCRA